MSESVHKANASRSRSWWGLATTLLLILIAVAPWLLSTPMTVGHAGGQSLPADTLVVMSPHNDQIRFEFSSAFSRWRQEQGKPAVRFDWRSSGGTSDLRKQVVSQFAALAEHGLEGRGIGVDLFFGGGVFEHRTLARGLTVQRGAERRSVSLTAPMALQPLELNTVFPQPTIGGSPLYDLAPSQIGPRWVGTALSSFGIIWNVDALAMLNGLPTPLAWQDLCDPRYRGWLAMADPGHSGSVAATFDTILQRKGWDLGWSVLRRMCANARYFAVGAAKVPLDVSAGEAAAGMCIDFYGRFQAGAVPAGRVGYVDPRAVNIIGRSADAPLETAVTADPVSILCGAPNPTLALSFVRWLLGRDGQGLWQRRLGDPQGPQRYELRRLPVRRDMYVAQEMNRWRDHVKPFEQVRPLPENMPSFYKTVPPLVHAMAMDVHDDLKAAWSVIVTHRKHPQRRRMLALFDAFPQGSDKDGQDISLNISWPDGIDGQSVPQILADPMDPWHEQVVARLAAFVDKLERRYTLPGSARKWNDRAKLMRHRLAWTRFFRANYREIVAMGEEGG